MFNELSEDEEKYSKFYEAFSKNLKLGIHEDATNRNKIAKLLRYNTTKSDEQITSLDDYISRMSENQKGIYYITGESIQIIKSSPFLETLKNKNIEVIYMVDPVDEYAVQQLKEYNGKKLISVTSEDLELDDDEKKNLEQLNKDNETLCSVIKNILGDKIEKVAVSSRLNESPCVLITGEYGMSANMERIMKSQTLGSSLNKMPSKKIMEINPTHKIMIHFRNKYTNVDDIDNTARNIINLMYETTLLTSGFSLDDPSVHAERIYKLVNFKLSIDDDEDVEDIQDIENIEKKENDDSRNEENTMEQVD
jgi:molecular chaperone HtpG